MPRKAVKRERGIREVAPGVWEVNVSAGIDPAKSASGTRQYRRVYRRVHGTVTDARNARAALQVEVHQGRYGGTDATVNDLLDAWLRELDREGKAPKTIASYRNYANAHVRPIYGPLKVRQVTSRMIADHLASLKEAGAAANTIRLVHATLSSAFTQAMHWGWIPKTDDPTKVVKRPSIPNKRPTIPTVDEVSKVLTAARTSPRPELAAAIWLSATTGVRRGELCALRLSDFDLETGRMQIERAISEREVWTTKNRRWREVALDPLTVAVVEGQIVLLRQRAEKVGVTFPDDGYLFTDHPRGAEPWNPHVVTDGFRQLTKKLKLPHLTFHQLRKFMESRALDAGFSVAEVAHRAGHDPAVLMRFYAGGVDESGKALAQAVASLLAPEGQ